VIAEKGGSGKEGGSFPNRSLFHQEEGSYRSVEARVKGEKSFGFKIHLGKRKEMKKKGPSEHAPQ